MFFSLNFLPTFVGTKKIEIHVAAMIVKSHNQRIIFWGTYIYSNGYFLKGKKKKEREKRDACYMHVCFPQYGERI